MTHARLEPGGVVIVGGHLADGSSQGSPRSIGWSEIVQVTLDEPMRDDQPIIGRRATWELATIDGEFATIDAHTSERTQLLRLLAERLPGFDLDAAEQTYAAGPGKRFRRVPVDGTSTLIWRRAVVRCPSCKEADLVEAPDSMSFEGETPQARWERRMLCPRCEARVPLGRRKFVR